MFNQLLFVRLKAAENALRDGRLDEAYRLASNQDLRDHRRGGAVLAALTECFIERARNHYRTDRFGEALADLDRAEAGGVMKEEIAELRRHIHTVAAEQRRKEESRYARLGDAKRRIEAGSLAAGRKILEKASEGDPAARSLREGVAQRAEDVVDTVAQAARMMSEGQLAAAADRLRRAKKIDAHHADVVKTESKLCAKVLDNARAALNAGRLGRAADELACLGDLGASLPAKRELADVLRIVREAAGYVERHDYAQARTQLMTLQRLLPSAKWVRQTVDQLRKIEEIQESICAGPLGDRMESASKAVASPPVAAKRDSSLDETIALAPRGKADQGSDDKLLLLVDGGGSYLVLRNPQASIGRAATEHPADVPIFSDIAERHANVTRVDEDYFLFSTKDVQIGGRTTRHQLLRDGDRVHMGSKAKFYFRVPSRKSPTAVLDLSDTTKMPHDVRRVILLDKHATIGSGPTAHVRCRNVGTPLVLFERNGALCLRKKNNGHVDSETIELRIDEPIEVGGVSLVLKHWPAPTPEQKT